MLVDCAIVMGLAEGNNTLLIDDSDGSSHGVRQHALGCHQCTRLKMAACAIPEPIMSFGPLEPNDSSPRFTMINT